jgi:hypothetical protein
MTPTAATAALRMAMAMRRLGFGDEGTVHGFRQCLSTWAREHTRYRIDTIEAALAHRDEDKVARAYSACCRLLARAPRTGRGLGEVLHYAATEKQQGVAEKRSADSRARMTMLYGDPQMGENVVAVVGDMRSSSQILDDLVANKAPLDPYIDLVTDMKHSIAPYTRFESKVQGV